MYTKLLRKLHTFVRRMAGHCGSSGGSGHCNSSEDFEEDK